MKSKTKNPVPESFEELVGQQAPVTGILYDVTNNVNNLNGYLVNGSSELKDGTLFIAKQHIEERLEEIYIDVDEILDTIATAEDEIRVLQRELDEKEDTIQDIISSATDFVENLIEEIVADRKEEYPDIDNLLKEISFYKKQLQKELDRK